ncbi:MAG TPA: adenylate/guanylate cyclase domain-containing protein [Saprospiraceae bacterium]|nr:adenylate/guanylate cyclase domain-containing protein [Saprospiraceae bacterium]
MSFNSKRKWRIIQQYIIGWSLAFMFLSIVRGEGTTEIGSVEFKLWKATLVSLIGGPIFGTLSGYAQILTEEYGYKKISLIQLLLLRIAFAILFLALMITLAYFIFGEDISYLEFAFEPGSFAIYLFILSTDVFMFCLRQVHLFMGSNNLWKLLIGQYYTPREEERIFMFLDLQSSTTHAERLGHITYSKMIQDCFNDLGVVIQNDAEIYQYVGDEAILTWKLRNGIKNENCLNAYYRFQEQIVRKKSHYTQYYDCLPVFRAGMHSGIVTVTEVGKYKKEIAYHGDTINTAARIQGQCKTLNQDFITSEDLKNKLNSDHFSFDKLGTIDLRGKKEPVPLFAVNLKT